MQAIDELIRRFGVDLSSAPPDEVEEFAYEVAARELHFGNGRPGLMARAFADASGDERKAKALYLRMRAAQLLRDYERAAIGQRQRVHDARAPSSAAKRRPREDPEGVPASFVVFAFLGLLILVFAVAVA